MNAISHGVLSLLAAAGKPGLRAGAAATPGNGPLPNGGAAAPSEGLPFALELQRLTDDAASAAQAGLGAELPGPGQGPVQPFGTRPEFPVDATEAQTIGLLAIPAEERLEGAPADTDGGAPNLDPEVRDAEAPSWPPAQDLSAWIAALMPQGGTAAASPADGATGVESEAVDTLPLAPSAPGPQLASTLTPATAPEQPAQRGTAETPTTAGSNAKAAAPEAAARATAAAISATPATPAVPATPGTPATRGTAATPASPATPATTDRTTKTASTSATAPSVAAVSPTPASQASAPASPGQGHAVPASPLQAKRDPDGAVSAASERFGPAAASAAGPGTSQTLPVPAAPLASLAPLASMVASPMTSVAVPAQPTSAPAEANLPQPFGSPEFVPALGAQIAAFARDGIEHARVHLNPAEMGPIQLQIALDGTQVRVDFAAEMGATRQLLEQSLPTLASTLREGGFTLAGGGVFQQTREGGGRGDEPRPGAPGGSGTGRGNDATALPATPTSAARGRVRGLVDLYA